MKIEEILSKCDHTLLAQTATWEEIKAICDDGIKYHTASVCIPASYVKQAKNYVGGLLPICTVIGFPNGYDTTAAKCFMAADAVENGADEVDMVINLGWVKDGLYDQVRDEIALVKKACRGKLLKVIIETCLLTDDEKIAMCKAVSDSGADYIKTSTGFSTAGATFHDVEVHFPGRFPSGHLPHCQAGKSHGTKLKGENRMLNTPTPHISAAPGDFGKTVLMPGDPLRAKFIAETFLENPVLVNDVRGVQGHTGYYKGVKVSVMASGMGMPAIGIYSHELYNGYGVENIIRVGSAGSIQEKVKLYDLVIGQGACTHSNFAAQFHLPGTFAPIASWELLKEAVGAAEANGARYHVGNLNSSDVFYGDHEGVPAGLDSVYGLQKMGVLALEMEAAALYMNAARYGKRALAICTISDSLVTGEETTSQERQSAFTTMMKVALDVAVAMENR